MGIAEAEEAGGYEQEGHEDDVACLGHVAAKGGDKVDGELGGGLEVALDVRFGSQPGTRRDGLKV